MVIDIFKVDNVVNLNAKFILK